MENKRLAFFSKEKPWQDHSNDIWLASTVALHRNVDKFNFPSKMPLERRQQMISLIGQGILPSKELQEPKLYKAEELSPFEKEFLAEHFLSTPSFQQAHNGEAFVLDARGDFLATVNINDHLVLLALDYKGELESLWNRITKLESELGSVLSYAFSQRYGFLTSNLLQCGTALTVSAYLQVPAMIHTEKVDEILENYSDENISVAGMHGSPTEIIGDVLVIQNQFHLGVNEETILSTIHQFITKLIIEETSLRQLIQKNANVEIMDRVSRAYGILIHSYQIEAVEALNAISLLKLGVELGWIEGIDLSQLNQLFFNCRRAHLLHEIGEKIEQTQLGHKRAEYIHKFLKPAVLKI